MPAQQTFKESVNYAEQNLYSKTQALVGDRNPTEHEFSIQLRSFESAKSGAGTGMAVLIGMVTALMEKITKGGLVVLGQLNLGGSLDLIYDAIHTAETAVEKGATTLLISLNARKQLIDLSDDMITKINNQYYTELQDC
ncbi:hypothetical protein NMK71_04820 [Weeksellaceae bacterium KMM 9713]|uniref:Lon proteolytic domain-containing protein n=1 Tax=Profundicola chukchiensis TaxID=2961959 RepID=A0A9X4MVQ0_9FLAO|nr:hypothetical protein [Profundicola chukchiensis]MDG4945728.1 hypothetical protein [Profundicola chukchiensis]